DHSAPISPSTTGSTLSREPWVTDRLTKWKNGPEKVFSVKAVWRPEPNRTAPRALAYTPKPDRPSGRWPSRYSVGPAPSKLLLAWKPPPEGTAKGGGHLSQRGVVALRHVQVAHAGAAQEPQVLELPPLGEVEIPDVQKQALFDGQQVPDPGEGRRGGQQAPELDGGEVGEVSVLVDGVEPGGLVEAPPGQ